MELATLIKGSREELGLDQAEVTRRLGSVSQQTFSKWERGLSRPRFKELPRLSEVLGIPLANLQEAWEGPGGGGSKPVRPLVPTLPLADLVPDRFEAFTADLMGQLHEPPVVVQRYGSQGHKQYGVDVVAQLGERLVDTYQCKREAEFGAAKVRDAVAAVTVEAERHTIMLTRTASPGARQEIQKHPGWRLFDIEDISRLVRMDLYLGNPDAAVRLVRTYFGAYLESFLGVSDPGPWLTVDEFYQPFLGDQVLSHDWELVGREAELKAILSAFSPGAPNVVVLVGHGGLGKSRLLKASAQALDAGGHQVRFLSSGIDLTPNSFETLPKPRPLVIVDDAHDQEQLQELLLGCRRNGPVPMLLGTRPYGLDKVKSQLARAGVHATEIQTVTLQDLSLEEALLLVAQATGGSVDSPGTQQLAAISQDCPLIAVVGGGLLRRGLLDVNTLDSDDRIRDEILRAFRDALVADPANGDAKGRAVTLDVVAALQPVRTADPQFRTTLSAITSMPFDQVLKHLRSLENAGVLLRRGESLRIVPDLLGDVILADACYDRVGHQPTGYLDRLRSVAEGLCLQHLFINASRIDWQLSRHALTGGSPRLADDLWTGLVEEYRRSGLRGRSRLLELVDRVAYFQPRRALEVVQLALAEPTTEVEEPGDVPAKLYRPSPEDVIHALPGILRSTAHHGDCLVESLDILWQLARTDNRPTNPHPDHPLRVLTSLTEYSNTKPLGYLKAIADHVASWRPVETAGGPSRFDVLEPLLVTEGHDQTSTEAISFSPYAIDPTVVRALRRQVVQLALDTVRGDSVTEAGRAARFLESSIRYPTGLFARPVADEERAAWTPDFVWIIERIGALLTEEAVDPAVKFVVAQSLDWHAHHSSTATAPAAAAALAKLDPAALPNELTASLIDGWRHHRGRLDPVDYEAANQRREQGLNDLADRLLNKYDDAALCELLDQRLTAIRSVYEGKAISPGPLVVSLVRLRPSLGGYVIDALLENRLVSLTPLISVFLSALADSSVADAVKLARRVLQRAPHEAPSVAHAFSWGRGGRSEVEESEAELLRELAGSKDPAVRACVARAAQLVGPADAAFAVNLLGLVDFSDSVYVAREVLTCFTGYGFTKWSDIPTAVQHAVLNRLTACPTLDEYEVMVFLATLSAEAPGEALRLMSQRVEREEELSAPGVDTYHAIPFFWHVPLRFREHETLARTLRGVLVWIAERPESWRRIEEGGRLFSFVVGERFDDAVRSVLTEAAGNVALIPAVAAVCKHVPRQIVLSEPEFVSSLLEGCAPYGDEAVAAVGGALHGAATLGSKSGDVGKPFKEDVEVRDACREILPRLDQSTWAYRFYESVLGSAERAIDEAVERDRAFRDRREW